MKRPILASGMIAAVIAVTSTSVIAQQMGQGGMRQGPGFDFEELDANGDGKITQDEMQTRAQDRFKAADTDGDGAISAEEMTARMQARMAERMAARVEMMMKTRDADKDGKISMEEMQPGQMGRMFERHDSDGDGAISAEEFADIRKNNRGGRKYDGTGMHGKMHGERHKGYDGDKGCRYDGYGKGYHRDEGYHRDGGYHHHDDHHHHHRHNHY